MIPRAERFPMQIPLKYRAVGDSDWLNGTTRNISASSVLFTADAMLERSVPVEMRIVFPGQIAHVAHGRVMCHGPAACPAPRTAYRTAQPDLDVWIRRVTELDVLDAQHARRSRGRRLSDGSREPITFAPGLEPCELQARLDWLGPCVLSSLPTSSGGRPDVRDEWLPDGT